LKASSGLPKGNGVEKLSLYLAVAGSEFLPDGWRRHAYIHFSVVNQLSDELSQARGDCFSTQCSLLDMRWKLIATVFFFLMLFELVGLRLVSMFRSKFRAWFMDGFILCEVKSMMKWNLFRCCYRNKKLV